MKKILTKKGFTLIELIVVIAILAILAAILIPSITNYIDEAEKARDQANVRSYYSALLLSEATGGTAPSAPTGATCTGTTDLSCTLNGRVYSVANNFAGVPTTP